MSTTETKSPLTDLAADCDRLIALEKERRDPHRPQSEILTQMIQICDKWHEYLPHIRTDLRNMLISSEADAAAVNDTMQIDPATAIVLGVNDTRISIRDAAAQIEPDGDFAGGNTMILRGDAKWTAMVPGSYKVLIQATAHQFDNSVEGGELIATNGSGEELEVQLAGSLTEQAELGVATAWVDVDGQIQKAGACHVVWVPDGLDPESEIPFLYIGDVRLTDSPLSMRAKSQRAVQLGAVILVPIPDGGETPG